MGRDQDHRRAEIGLGEAASQIEAALAAEHDVHQDDVGAQLAHLPERAVAGRRGADHVHALPLEQGGSRLEKGMVVVDNHTPNRHIRKRDMRRDRSHWG
jgi:hypothetical protein